MSLLDEERALTEGVGAVDLARDAVVVRGPDAATFLQGQLSQDVAALAVGGSADSLLLQPTGKVAALVRVTRPADDELVLDVEEGFGPLVVERLERFKLRVKADLEPLAWRGVALRGPGAAGLDGLPASWPGWPGVDLVGAGAAAPDGVRRCPPEALEAVRIAAGVPRMGTELDERTIPEEAGVVERAVSFTKGCFTGQELVARIDSRGGNVPRRLRRLAVAGDAVPPPGADVVVADKVVGEVTSAARSALAGAPVALAYVQRSVEAPAAVTLCWDGGTAEAEALTQHR